MDIISFFKRKTHVEQMYFQVVVHLPVNLVNNLLRYSVTFKNRNYFWMAACYILCKSGINSQSRVLLLPLSGECCNLWGLPPGREMTLTFLKKVRRS